MFEGNGNGLTILLARKAIAGPQRGFLILEYGAILLPVRLWIRLGIGMGSAVYWNAEC